MSSTNEGLSDSKFKILEENDISYPQTPPDISEPPEVGEAGGEWAEDEGAGVGSNSARGVIVAVVPVSRDILHDARTGLKSYAVNYSDGSRKIVNNPAMMKIIDKQLMDGLAKTGAAIIERNLRAAGVAKNDAKRIGVAGKVEFGAFGKKVTIVEGQAGYDPNKSDGDGVTYGRNMNEVVKAPRGFDVTFGVSVSGQALKEAGLSQKQRDYLLKVQQAQKEYNEIEDEWNEKKWGDDVQAANDKRAKAHADLIRKYGEEIGRELVK